MAKDGRFRFERCLLKACLIEAVRDSSLRAAVARQRGPQRLPGIPRAGDPGLHRAH